MKHHRIVVWITMLPLSAPAAPDSMVLDGIGEAYYLVFIKLYEAELYTHNNVRFPSMVVALTTGALKARLASLRVLNSAEN